MWTEFLFKPLLNALVGFYQIFGNLGTAIIALTVCLRVVLLPLTLPLLKTAQKMKDIAPKLDKLKKKYKDKQALAKAQMDLYRNEGIKPMAGLLPQIIQIVILIALYQAFRQVLGDNGGVEKLNEFLYDPLKLASDVQLNLKFFYLKLTDPDFIMIAGKKIPGIFLLLSAGAQFLSAKLRFPSVKAEAKVAKKTEAQSDDFASMMQTQSLYMFPLMSILIGLSFPSGLVLYWATFSLFNVAQQIIIEKRFKKSS